MLICLLLMSWNSPFPSLGKTFREALKRKLEELRKLFIQAKAYDVIEMYECDWSKKYKEDNFVEQHVRECLPYKMPLTEKWVLEKLKSGSLFGYVQCNIEVPENLRETTANFRPIFKNFNVDWDDIGPFMIKYAKKEGLLTQLRKMLTLSFFSENGTIITPLLLFYMYLGLVCKKTVFDLCNTLQWSASTVLFNLRWKLEEKETRIQFLLLWQRQSSYQQTVFIVTSLWIGADIQ